MALSRLRPWKQLPVWERRAESTFYGWEWEEPLTAWVQLKGLSVFRSS